MAQFIPEYATLHYRTSFEIYGASAITDSQKKIRNWLCNLLKRNQLDSSSICQSWFYTGRDTDSVKQIGDFQIRTAVAAWDSESNPTIWGMELIHPDRECPQRFWSVEITLNQIREECVRLILVSKHFMREYYVGIPYDSPSASTPRVIKNLLEDNSSCIKKGESIISSQPIYVGAERDHLTVSQIYKELTSPSRILPYIFITDNIGIDPVKLTKQVLGNANVYVITTRDVCDELNYYLKECRENPYDSRQNYLYWYDSVRCYLGWGEKTHHHYFSRSELQQQNGAEEITKCLVTGLSRFVPLKPGDLVSIADVIVERKLNARKRKIEEQGKLHEEASQLLELSANENKELEGELKNVWDEVYSLTKENEDLKEGKRRLEEDIQKLVDSNRSEKEKGESSRKMFLKIREYLDIDEQLELYESTFPSKIVVLDDAKRSAKDIKKTWNTPDKREKSWDMLHDLIYILYPLFFPDEGIEKSKQIENEFNENSQFKFSMREGKQTNRAKDFQRQRERMYNGKIIDITYHIKYGTTPGNLLRLYLFVDYEEKKIVIGHIGGHLPNATTRSVH